MVVVVVGLTYNTRGSHAAAVPLVKGKFYHAGGFGTTPQIDLQLAGRLGGRGTTKPMAIGFFSVGEKVPLVTSPTGWPLERIG